MPCNCQNSNNNRPFDFVESIRVFNHISSTDICDLDDPRMETQMGFVTEEYEELMEAFEEAFESTDYNELVGAADVLKELGDLVVVTIGAMVKLGADPTEVMKAVCESNMSKFCRSEEEAQKTVDHIKEHHSDRYDAVFYEKSPLMPDLWVVKGHQIGYPGNKILKSIKSRKADSALTLLASDLIAKWQEDRV